MWGSASALLGSMKPANPSATDAETFLHMLWAKPRTLPSASSEIHGNWECVAPGKTKLAVKTLWKEQGLHTKTWCSKLSVSPVLLFASMNQHQDHGVEKLVNQGGESAARVFTDWNFIHTALITWLILPWFYNKILANALVKPILPWERRAFPTIVAAKTSDSLHNCWETHRRATT